jgi:hypothetical protein
VDHDTIRGHLQSARAILEHATGGAAAAGLLDLLRNHRLRSDEAVREL